MVLKFNKAKADSATATEVVPATETKAEPAVAATDTTAQLKSASVAIHLTQEQLESVEVFVRGRSEIDPFTQLIKDVEKNKKSLAEFVGTQVPNDETAEIETEAGNVSFSPAPDTRKIKDIDGLIKALREKAKVPREVVLTMLSINLGEADKYLGEKEVDKYVEHVPGTRRVASYVCKSTS